MKKHTILFLAANPSGTDRISLDREARSIQVELDRSGYRDQFEFETRWAAEPLDLLRELRKVKPTVVHYSGHGSEGGLFFQTPEGRAHIVSTAAIAETFGAAGASVKLVVLNACYSAEHADALLAHVDCVVGMGDSIQGDAARSFAIGFYGGLAERESVATAYKQGRAAIRLVGLGDGARPQLKIREVMDMNRSPLTDTEHPQLKVRRGVDANQFVLGTVPQHPRLTPPTLVGLLDFAGERQGHVDLMLSAPRASKRSVVAAKLVSLATMTRESSRRTSIAVIACVGAAVCGLHVATHPRGEVPHATAHQSPVPEAPEMSPSAPLGMVSLPALELDLASTKEEIVEVFAWCKTLVTPADCRKDLYSREWPVHHVRLSALLFDAHERSTGEVAAWLSTLPGLREEGGWVVAGGVRLAEIGDGHDLRWQGTAIVPRSGTDQLPAVDVTYDGARKFCQARGMDLPTEAQWERAARGLERRRFPWGNLEPTCDRAIYGRGSNGPCPPNERAPVDADTGDRTPEGIANLAGNVAEWVIDRYIEGGYMACSTPCIDPVMAPTSDQHELHVIRGGAFESLAEQLRGAGRGRARRDAAFGNTGFRCAAPLKKESL